MTVDVREKTVRRSFATTLRFLALDVDAGKSKADLLVLYASVKRNPLLSAVFAVLIESLFHDINHGKDHDI